jgi:hypothetical protein
VGKVLLDKCVASDTFKRRRLAPLPSKRAS